jgi:hypothetical protein
VAAVFEIRRLAQCVDAESKGIFYIQAVWLANKGRLGGVVEGFARGALPRAELGFP